MLTTIYNKVPSQCQWLEITRCRGVGGTAGAVRSSCWSSLMCSIKTSSRLSAHPGNNHRLHVSCCKWSWHVSDVLVVISEQPLSTTDSLVSDSDYRDYRDRYIAVSRNDRNGNFWYWRCTNTNVESQRRYQRQCSLEILQRTRNGWLQISDRKY